MWFIIVFKTHFLWHKVEIILLIQMNPNQFNTLKLSDFFFPNKSLFKYLSKSLEEKPNTNYLLFSDYKQLVIKSLKNKILKISTTDARILKTSL